MFYSWGRFWSWCVCLFFLISILKEKLFPLIRKEKKNPAISQSLHCVCLMPLVCVWALFFKDKWIVSPVSSTEIKDCLYKEDLAVSVTAHVIKPNNSTNVLEIEFKETNSSVFLSPFKGSVFNIQCCGVTKKFK